MKKDKYLDIGWELKKRWNIKMTLVPNVTGALSTPHEGLIKCLEHLEIKGREETIKTIVFLRSVRIQKRGLEETCCHSNFSERLSRSK